MNQRDRIENLYKYIESETKVDESQNLHTDAFTPKVQTLMPREHFFQGHPPLKILESADKHV
jgi:hypothetical protein